MEVCLQLESGMRPGSCRGPGGVFLQLKSGAKFSSRRSPDEACLQLESEMRSGSRRSPDVAKNLVGTGGVLLVDKTWECCGGSAVWEV